MTNQVPLPPIHEAQHTNPGSFFVRFTLSEAEIVQTHFAPGYTPAHKATPVEAVEALELSIQQLIDNSQFQLEMLAELKAQLLSDPKAGKRVNKVRNLRK